MNAADEQVNSAMRASKEPVSGSVAQRHRAAKTATPPPAALSQHLGNRQLQMLLRARVLHAKLTISDPNDVYEQEADRIADQVMRMPEPSAQVADRAAPTVLRSANGETLQRSPTATSPEPRARHAHSQESGGERHIDELACDPYEAHQEWQRLSRAERSAVLERMRRRFGDAFADQFLAAASAGTAQPQIIYWQPGAGPSVQDLVKQGYRWGGRELTGNAGIEVEIWVHPTGKYVRRDISKRPPPTKDTRDDGTKDRPPKDRGTKDKPPQVDDPPPEVSGDVAKVDKELFRKMYEAHRKLANLCWSDEPPIDDQAAVQTAKAYAKAYKEAYEQLIMSENGITWSNEDFVYKFGVLDEEHNVLLDDCRATFPGFEDAEPKRPIGNVPTP